MCENPMQWESNPRLAELTRVDNMESVPGFVLNEGGEYVTIHQLNWNMLVLDGYVAVPWGDVTGWSKFDEELSWIGASLKRHLQEPRRPWHSPGFSIEKILRQAKEHFGCFAIETERITVEEMYVGGDFVIKGQSLEISSITPQAERGSVLTIALSDITKVSFGTGYQRALLEAFRAGEDSVEGMD